MLTLIHSEWNRELLLAKEQRRPPSLSRAIARIHGVLVFFNGFFCVIAVRKLVFWPTLLRS